MSMQTMNPNAGGPVGGMLMMNNGSPAVSVGMNSDARSTLNTYIYDYLLKNGHYDSARSLANDGKFEFQHGPKLSPGRRKDGDMNGDADGMDMDPKDDAPEDMPRPANWSGTSGSAFLFEWFNIFMDLFSVHSNRNNGGKGAVQAAQYLMHEKNNQRARETIQNQNLMRNPNAMLQQMRGVNGMPNGKLPAGVSQQQLAAMQAQKRQQQMVMQQQMQQRDQADDSINTVRPGTPTEGEAAGSPSKRQRLENGQQNFPPGVMPNGQRPGMPGAQNQAMLMQTPFTPAMAQQFRQQQNGAMPQKPMNVPNAMMNASSPMMANMNQFGENMNMGDMYPRANMPGQQPMQANGGPQSSGNHALQDYQMQLMLLEQQNKKRLMMARQEQHDNQPGAAGMQGVNMQGLSPSGSRTGSPSANEGINGRSPAAMNFGMGNMPGADFNPMFMKDQQMMPGGPQMRPPTSNDINMRQAGARPNFQQGGQPMQQTGSQAGQAMGTPGQRNEMPPPSAPANGAQSRNNGNSPSGNAPPTPQTSNKANPKSKKAAAKEDTKRPRPNKKGSTANAPASDDNPPATPQPSTPITPNNPGAMNNGNKNQPGMPPGNQHQNPGMMNQQMPQNDFPMDFNAGSGPGGEPFNLDFSTLESADVLENFDFDSFLNTSADEGFNFGADVEIGQGFGMGEGE